MKLSTLASPTETRVELIHPKTNEPIGIFICGHTPDSRDYKKMEKQIVNSGVAKSIHLNKNASPSMEIDKDAADKRFALLIAVITDITGAEDFEYSAENKNNLLNNPLYHWMVEQWGEHLDDRANFFEEPEQTA